MSYSSQVVTQGQALLSSSRRPVGGGIKRTFDFAAACVAIVTLLPLFLACCLLIAVTSPGPVLFCHRRLGFGGREFCCLKFRTMQVDAERRLKEYLASNSEARQEWETHHKLKSDPRITPVGQFLRRTSLDELPQLFNVLMGDMSLVGPRPPVPREVALYSLADRRRLAVLPGITCIWQISGRAEIDFPGQVKLDVRYIETQSIWQDIKILAKTIPAVASGSGAY